jgi:hypothetical protein
MCTWSSWPAGARRTPLRAAAHDLKVFFSAVDKVPEQVRPADVLMFITAQRISQAAGSGALQLVKRGMSRAGRTSPSPISRRSYPLTVICSDVPREPAVHTSDRAGDVPSAL